MPILILSLPRPLCSRVRPDVRDRRQTNSREIKTLLNACAIWGRRHNYLAVGYHSALLQRVNRPIASLVQHHQIGRDNALIGRPLSGAINLCRRPKRRRRRRFTAVLSVAE